VAYSVSIGATSSTYRAVSTLVCADWVGNDLFQPVSLELREAMRSLMGLVKRRTIDGCYQPRHWIELMAPSSDVINPLFALIIAPIVDQLIATQTRPERTFFLITGRPPGA